MILRMPFGLDLSIRRWKNSCSAHPVPDREVLRLQDDAEIWEAETSDELTTRLCNKYPDRPFARTSHTVRDHEAEERRERALNERISILERRSLMI